jgi:hypothetical protein
MRRIVLTLLALAVPLVIAVVAARQTADLPALGGEAWVPIVIGLVLIAVVIALLLWAQLRKR